MLIKIKRLNKNAIVPTSGSEHSAGHDLYACLEQSVQLLPQHTVMIPTGWSMALPENTVGLIFARSGLATKQDLAPANKVGVVDSDYRGEYLIALHNHGHEVRTIHHGDRVAQLVVVPYIKGEFEEVNELDQTTRGDGGFGSTGK